jgi:hypothetical protein
MIGRVLVLAGGLVAGLAFSQFPAFSQQYLQRLGGAVDALEEVVSDFDASAAAVGLDREQALAQMRGTAFLDRRRADMTRTFARYDRLWASLQTLEGEGPFIRAYRLPHMTDPEIAAAAWAAFRPALPLTFAGVVFAGVGFLAGALGLTLLLRLLAWPLRRRHVARGEP